MDVVVNYFYWWLRSIINIVIIRLINKVFFFYVLGIVVLSSIDSIRRMLVPKEMKSLDVDRSVSFVLRNCTSF